MFIVYFSQFTFKHFKCAVGEEKPPPLVDVDSVKAALNSYIYRVFVTLQDNFTHATYGLIAVFVISAGCNQFLTKLSFQLAIIWVES